MIVADESLNANFTHELRKLGYEIYAIQESDAGISDKEVIEISKRLGSILITEDKDFGEWIFSHHIKDLSVIFLRYEKKYFEKVLNALIDSLNQIDQEPDYQFITITKDKIRKRKL
ncbi:MAG: DUF5615 family PIN-like protein [Verrucomicrobia bacterium]|nr:DUF5615 family PIN-like protein [Cytophagales bacterium]